jgi:hypothetical protein
MSNEQLTSPSLHPSTPPPLHPSPLSLFHPSILDPYLWLTLLLTLPALGPLLQLGYHWGAHDARHSVYFLYEFNHAIQDGIWYPRWSPNFAFGYGYPFFNIYGPLSSYAGQALLGLGFDLVTAVKIVFGLSALLSGLTMFLFARRLFGSPGGLVAALVYVYLPYHLFDLYVRAALAESVGFVFMPLLWWGFCEVVTRSRLAAILGAALAYAGLMLTSNLLALMFTPILGLYVAVMIIWEVLLPSNFTSSETPTTVTGQTKQRKVWRALAAAFRSGLPSLFALLLGLGLSGIFWLPAFIEYNFVRVDQWIGGRFAFGDDFVEFFQLFSPKWGFGPSLPGPDDETGFQLGLAAFILFVFSFLIVPKLADPQLRRTCYFFQIITLVLVCLTTPLSSLVWTVLPLSSFAQFPWRLLVVIAPFISILASTILAEQLAMSKEQLTSASLQPFASAQGKPSNLPILRLRSGQAFQPSILPILFASLILLASYPYLQAEVRDPKPTEGPVSQAALFRFQQSADEMTGQTAWVQRIPNWSALAEQVERGGEITTKVNYTALPADNSVGVYSMEMSSVHELLWIGTEQEGQTITFFIPYYPGWTAYIYEDLGPHDGNLDKDKGPVTRIGPLVEQPQIRTTPIEGWMVAPIPTGSHFLELRFEDTPIRVVGLWVSVISIVIWIGLIMMKRAFK